MMAALANWWRFDDFGDYLLLAGFFQVLAISMFIWAAVRSWRRDR